MKANGKPNWTPADSAELYGIRSWGAGYFDLDDDGAVTVSVTQEGKRVSVSIPDIIAGMQQRGLQMPVLLRFENLLDSQITLLNETFARRSRSLGYRGSYRGVYPIKVNQQQQVIEEITRFGARYHHGLEAGSKAELIAALAYMHDPEALHRLQRLQGRGVHRPRAARAEDGLQMILVLEMPSELDLILERAATHRRPADARRARQARRRGRRATGRSRRRPQHVRPERLADDRAWSTRCATHDMLDCLQLLHYHLGSQIPNIRDIRSGVLEACRFYVDLVKEGAQMGILDIGGGLAVDYDGSQTNFASSSNYRVDEYCADIVEAIMSTLTDEAGIAHPTIVSESGRADGGLLLRAAVQHPRRQPLRVRHSCPSSSPPHAPELHRAT